VRGVARFISSGKKYICKNWTWSKDDSHSCRWSKMDTPKMSPGSKSLAALNTSDLPPTALANALAKCRLPTPGTSSMRNVAAS